MRLRAQELLDHPRQGRGAVDQDLELVAGARRGSALGPSPAVGLEDALPPDPPQPAPMMAANRSIDRLAEEGVSLEPGL